ncbi:MAG: hypothetical protein JWN71_3203 [Xanthobacteraceae bacterium]|nr:hypothetical protein [Xanthobacteraceae bacterium]
MRETILLMEGPANRRAVVLAGFWQTAITHSTVETGVQSASRRRAIYLIYCNNLYENGAQGRDRTTDTAIFNRMLYQLSYLGMPPAAKQQGAPGL